MLFNTLMIHHYLPADVITTAMVLIVKIKTGDTGDKNRYRLVTAASNLLEICILDVLETYLVTHDHQFINL